MIHKIVDKKVVAYTVGMSRHDVSEVFMTSACQRVVGSKDFT
jgi:hypothetical protein